MTDWPDGYARADFDTLDSTNEEARRRFLTNADAPSWITAAEQSAGRGRQGRAWQSLRGNLFATLHLPYGGDLATAARFGFHASLGVSDLVRILAPAVEISLKWPNDVLLNGKKVSGILLESLGKDATGRLHIAIGIGINLAVAPDRAHSRWPGTSVAQAAGKVPSPQDCLPILARRMAHWIELERRKGFVDVLHAWKQRAAQLGEVIEARLPSETVAGVFKDVDADGVLVLETNTGMRRIAAGDVFFPEHA